MKSAKQWMSIADELRRNCRFGEAVNAYRSAAACSDATDEMKIRAQVSVELIQEINSFVNTDLMNP